MFLLDYLKPFQKSKKRNHDKNPGPVISEVHLSIMANNFKRFEWSLLRAVVSSSFVYLAEPLDERSLSMKYIQEHYFHYRADESTEILGKGRKIKPAEESLRWIGSS